MASYSELISTVIKTFQNDKLFDPYSDDLGSIPIGELINQGVFEIAGGMESSLGSWITPPLPNLFTIDTVTTDTDIAFVDLPDNFHRNLQYACDENNRELSIANSMITFAQENSNFSYSGSLYEVAAFGNSLYYQRIPTTSQIITIHYYCLPTILVSDEAIPSCLPLHLQKPLLVNYALWKIYTLLTDGMQNEENSSLKYFKMFNYYLRILELSIPADTEYLNLIS